MKTCNNCEVQNEWFILLTTVLLQAWKCKNCSSVKSNTYEILWINNSGVSGLQRHLPKSIPWHKQWKQIMLYCIKEVYMGGSKIFRTGAVKIIKLTISPIGRRHPRSSSLPHVDTSPTVSSIFGTHPGSSFLWECQALSAFWPGCPQWYRTSVLSGSISF